jgi:hypothetical protein
MLGLEQAMAQSDTGSGLDCKQNTAQDRDTGVDLCTSPYDVMNWHT